MRKMVALFLALLLGLTASSALADSLATAGLDTRTITHEVNERINVVKPLWYNEWLAAYPGTKLNTSNEVPYKSTAALVKALTGKSFKQDVLALSSRDFDWAEVAASGGLTDLSDDPELSALVDGMHPLFAEAARAGGGLYGIPCGVEFGSFMSYLPDGWALAGYTAADVPTSFSGLITLLEGWAERCKAAPMQGIYVTSDFDRITPTCYTEWLTKRLIEQRVSQCMAEGKPITFNTPEIVALLERIAVLGGDLYALDDRVGRSNDTDGPAEETHDLLASIGADAKLLQYMIPSRMTDDDPLLIPVHVRMLCIPVNCKHPEAAKDFLRLYMGLIHEHVYDDPYTTTLWDCEAMLANALLFTDASGAVPSYDYGKAERVAAQIASQQAIVDDPTASEQARTRAQENLDRYARNHYLERVQAEEYQFTAEGFAAYQGLTGSMRVISGTSSIPYSKTTEKLVKQFAAGQITAQEFVRRMDEQTK